MSDFLDNYGIDEVNTDQKQNHNEKKTDDFFSDYPNISDSDSHALQEQNNKNHNKELNEIKKEVDDQENLDILFDELNSLIGLDKVKLEISRLIHFVKIQDLRRKKGLGTITLSLHSVFYGSPGTGKTTVARIYGKMLKALSLLENGHLIETDRSGLVANYVGQTANKTDEKIKEAIGGILFIDEAYSLYKGENAQWDYGCETIEILMKRMEDYRENLAIVVAGYPIPMNKFLNSNEGFKSRFANYIHFDDYLPDELIEIFISLCTKNNYILTKEAYKLIDIAINNAFEKKDISFGNARFCRNLFEKVIRNQAVRIGENISQPTEQQLNTIEGQDISPLVDM